MGNSLDVLIDGAEALPAIAGELERASSHVHLAGWYFSPDFALTREREPVVIRNLLAHLAERVEVRVLSWAGAPLPLFRPSRGTVQRMRETSAEGRGFAAHWTRTNDRCTVTMRKRSLSTTALLSSAVST